MQEAVEIQIFAIACRLAREPVREHSSLKFVEIVLDICRLLGRDFIIIGRFYCHRNATQRLKPRCLLIGISINLNEIASGESFALNVVGSHFGDFHTPRVHLHLVAKLIATLILAIEN